MRGDLDVPLRQVQGEFSVEDDSRIRECLPSIKYLLDHAAKVILMGHSGRPEGQMVEGLKLAPMAEKIKQLFNSQFSPSAGPVPLWYRAGPVPLWYRAGGFNFQLGGFSAYRISENLVLLENLRFYPGEENNDPQFAQALAVLGDLYVNEAFAASHREHASIVGVPKLLPHAAGFHFASEAEHLSKVLENPKRPLVLLVGGAKPETKLPLALEFAQKMDWVLIGGALAQSMKYKEQSDLKTKNILFASLTEDGFDIDGESIKKFSDIIKDAGTIIWNGPMGKYEEERWEAGTKRIAAEIAGCPAFKVVGGGDTIAALTKLNLIGKMDYVSTAGGAMLEYLLKGTLPGLEALK